MMGRTCGVVVLAAVILVRVSSGAPAATAPAPASVNRSVAAVTWGETQPLAPPAGGYQRVLVSFPATERMDAETSRKDAWTLGPDVFLRLVCLPGKDERWRTIGRNLGLTPDERFLWSEVADALFDTFGKTAPRVVTATPPFSLSVAFCLDAQDKPQPVGTLAFPRETEVALQAALPAAVTGIEGFVQWKTGSPDGPSTTEPAPRVQVDLLACDGKTVLQSKRTDAMGYFLFASPPLSSDRDLGSDAYVRVAHFPAAKDADEPVALTPENSTTYYMPVIQGRRSRLQVAQAMPMPGAKGAAPKTSKEVETSVVDFVGGRNALVAQILSTALSVAPRNPGLHVGVAIAHGQAAPLYASRIPFQPVNVPDYGPRPVPGAMMCLERWVPTDAPDRSYLRVVLFAHPSSEALSVKSRPLSRSLWGLSLGVSPNIGPSADNSSTLYSLGASYEVIPEFELVAGAGKGANGGVSPVYGFTLDLEALFRNFFHKPPSSSTE